MTRGGWVRGILRLLAGLAALVAVIVLLYRVIPVPLTPLMVLRMIEGEGLDHTWVAYAQLPPNLRRAVIASEDANFCTHHGFDFGAIQDAINEREEGERRRGASTITQQTAKNLFLWPGGGWARKVAEVYPTVLLELLWPKRRILQTYLDIVEWGPGVYGAAAASQHYFGRPVNTLTDEEAALLTAILPNPRRWSAARPTPYIRSRVATILARMPSAPTDCR